MSASKEKHERKSLYESGALDRDPAQTRRAASHKKRLKLLGLAAAVLLIAGAAVGLLASGFFARHTTAVTLGEHALSPATFGYFYWDAFYDYYRANQGDIAQVADARSKITTELYNADEKITWADHFIDQASATAAEVYAVYDAALSDGYALTEADQSYLDSWRSMLDDYAHYLKFDDAEAYVHDFYGRESSVDGYMAYMQVKRLATSYAASHKAALRYTPAEIDAAYAASPKDFESVSYKVYYVTHVTGKKADGSNAVDMQLSEQAAKRMAAECQNNRQRFDELAVELATEVKKKNYADPDFSLRTDDIISQATEPLRPWLSDPARQYGDTTYVQADDSGYYVGFFIQYNDNTYPLPNLHVAQIAAQADPANTADPDGTKRASTAAQALLTAFRAGPQTAAAFDAAAKAAGEQNDAVTASVQAPLTPTAAPDAVRQWCFDPNRLAGDTVALDTVGGSYVLYLDSYGPIYRDYLADAKLRSDDYKAWYAEISTAYSAQTHGLGLFFLHK